MKIFFSILGVLALIASLGTCVMSKSAIQETVSVTVLIVAVLALGFSAVLHLLEENSKKLLEQLSQLAKFLDEKLK